jgi:hypothetical protein
MATHEASDTGANSKGSAPAIVLWVLVVVALLYGVISTASKIPALFA